MKRPTHTKPARPAKPTDHGRRRRSAQAWFGDPRAERGGTPDLYLRAEARVGKMRKKASANSKAEVEVNTQRVLHELQVHQVELEMQNAELQEARGRMESLLEKYTDLYDFAPVGYLSLDEAGRILEVNLTGASLLGLGRAHLLNRYLPSFIVEDSRVIFVAFLKRVFSGAGKQVCEAPIMKANGTKFWADFHGTSSASVQGPKKWCRVVVSDITALKRAQEAQLRVEELALSNRELRREIVRRQAVEKSLKQSEQHQAQLLAQSQFMQEQLRHLSRQVLHAQEEERKRISRELHDVIAATLTGINVRLAMLAKEAGRNGNGFDSRVARTQKLVIKAVDVVHDFARQLRPAVLDDLGLVPALHAFMKTFTAQTGVRSSLTAFAKIEDLDPPRRTALFRVAQEALTNVARHAKATRVEVLIEKIGDTISMRVMDNGKSFKHSATAKIKASKRLGLLGMRERIEMIGGTFSIDAKPGEGTAVVAILPLAQPRAGTTPRRNHPAPFRFRSPSARFKLS
ncbi:MAG: ATP-binding protein [Limisphaerales bacterium]